MNAEEYGLEFEDRGSYLYALITGKDSFAASLSYWNRIADEVGRRGHDRLLVHECMAGKVSAREMYDLIMDLKDSALRKVRIAFYDENAGDSFLNLLGKLITAYSGGDVRIFTKLDAARSWIESPAD